MNKRALSSKEDLERALQEVGEALTSAVRAYLIGGCAMILYNAKLATKDIDLVVLSPDDAGPMIQALLKTGFRITVPREEVYLRLGTAVMM